MNLTQEKQEALRQEFLEDDRHESLMKNDVDYFCENLADTLYFKGADIVDVVTKIKQKCSEYNQDPDDVFEWLKEM